MSEELNQSQEYLGIKDPKIIKFLRNYTHLWGDEFSESKCLEYVNNTVEHFNNINCHYKKDEKKNEEKFQLYEGFNFNLPEVRLALTLAYVLHWGQVRKKDGSDYKNHFKVSVDNRFDFLRYEKQIFNVIMSSRNAVNGIIKLFLHDGGEDMFDNLGERVMNYDPQHPRNSNQPSSKLEKQKLLYDDLINVLYYSFDEEIVESVLYVFTNFSKRLLTTNSEIEGLTKEDIGRFDFFIRMISIKKIEDLVLTLCEKLHNLETKEVMDESKMIEYYNLAVSLMAAGLRSHAKSLLKEFFKYYMKRSDPDVAKDFFEKIRAQRISDRRHYNKHKVRLKSEFDMLYGVDNYQMEYRPLDDWRIHEIAIKEYIKLSPKALQRNVLDKSLAHYFISADIIDDALFQKILNAVPTYRVLVIVNDENDAEFHESRENFAPENYKLLSGAQVDYYANAGSSKLLRTDYKSFGFTLLSRDESDQKKIQCKGVLQSDYLRNEHGQFISKYDRDDDKNVKIKSVRSLRAFLSELQNRNVIDSDQKIILNALSEHPEGVSWNTKVGDIVRQGKNSPKLSNKYLDSSVEEVAAQISSQVKEELNLWHWLDRGNVSIIK